MAIKTQTDVERSFFAAVSKSNLAEAVKGSVIREGALRAANAQTEDIVLSCIAINAEQTQTCELGICIYVADLKNKDGDYTTNLSRFGTLEAEVLIFTKAFRLDDWTMMSYQMSRADVEAIHQHTLIVRLHLKRNSDDY